MIKIFSIVQFILVKGKNMNEGNSYMASAYLQPSVILWNSLEFNLNS